VITSVGNPVIRRVRRLRKRMWRERTSRVLVEGHRAVRSALSGGSVETVLYTPVAARLRADVIALAEGHGARAHEISPAVMSYLTSATTAPDVLAVAAMPLARAMRGPGLILSEVRDPATVGSVMASAAAVGFSSIVVAPGCADVFSGKCLRAAQGAHFRTAVVKVASLFDAVEMARAGGMQVVGLAEKGASPWETALAGPMMLVVTGATEVDPSLCDEVVAVPAGEIAPSLSARAAVVLYEWVRQGGATA
jgi:TrmH family RNA methyltransferase